MVGTSVGYTGGKYPFPTYSSVCSGVTGHTEAIRIEFDPNVISYSEILKVFWKNHSAFGAAKSQYKSAVFYTMEEHKDLVLASFQEEYGNQREMRTSVVKAGTFHLAEDYHQHYIAKRKKY